MENSLMEVKQLPVIAEQLAEVKADITKRTSEASKMVCTEDSVVAIKKVRSEFNKEFADYEAKRKWIKNEIIKPYMDFEAIYNECVSIPFKAADDELRTKINNVESELKSVKEDEVKSYFEELKSAEAVSFVEFKDAGVNITLSASLKSMKDKCKEFIEKVKTDMTLILSSNHGEEIQIEYMKCFNISQAMMIVKNRHEAMERMKQAQEERQSKAEEQEVKAEEIQKVVELSAPVEIEKQYTTSFKVTGTLSQLKELKRIF